jgi:hypothetical protein
MWLRDLANSLANEVGGAFNGVENFFGFGKKPDDNGGQPPAPTPQQAPVVDAVNQSIQTPNARNGLLQLAQQTPAAPPPTVAPIKITAPPPTNQPTAKPAFDVGNLARNTSEALAPGSGGLLDGIKAAIKNPNIIPTTHYADGFNDSGANDLAKMAYSLPQNFLNSPHDIAQGANTIVQGAHNNDMGQTLGGVGQLASGALNGPGLLVGGPLEQGVKTLAEKFGLPAIEAAARPLLQRALISSGRVGAETGAYTGIQAGANSLTANQNDPNGIGDQLYKSAMDAVTGGAQGFAAGAVLGPAGTLLGAGAKGLFKLLKEDGSVASPMDIINHGGPGSAPTGAPVGKEFSSGTAPFTTQEFLDRTSQAPDFQPGMGNLEENLRLLSGTHHANNILLDHMLGDQGFSHVDIEAAYHHAEDPSFPVTPTQRAIYEQHIKPQIDATKQIRDGAPREEGEALPEERSNYIHRIAQGKNSTYEKMLNMERNGVSESATRKTTDSGKARTYHALEDDQGNRKLVAMHTPKDEMGLAKGDKRVREITGPDEEGKDLGALHKALPPQVREFIDPALDKKLNDIAGGLGINHERVARLKGGRAGESEVGRPNIRTRAASAPDTILHEIGHQIDHKYDLQNHMFGGKRSTSDIILNRQIEKAKKLSTGGPESHKAFANDLAGNRADQLKLARDGKLEEAKSFLKSIRDEGGLATDKSIKEEMKTIPLNLRRAGGLTPDEMARSMANHGHYLEDGEHLRSEMQKHLATIADSGNTPSRSQLLDAAHHDLSHGADFESQAYQAAQKAAKSKDAMRLAEDDPAVKALTEQKAINGELRTLADARTPGREKPWTYARKGEEKMAVMFQAYLHHPDLFKEIAPTAFDRFTTFLDSHAETKPILDIQKAKSLELSSRVVGDKQMPNEFIDKNGKHWQIKDATTREIEANTNTRYFKNGIANSAINHVTTVNATVAKHFMEAFKLSPDFAEHAMKDDVTPKPGWKPAEAQAFRGYNFDPETKMMLDRFMGGSGAKTTTLVGKAWDGIGNVAIQVIVKNPLVHGGNLGEQALVAAGNIPGLDTGMGAFTHSLYNALDPMQRMNMIQNYLRAGGHFESYGADRITSISKALDAMNLPAINKLNSGAMRDIDATLRASLFDASVKHNMNPTDAVKNIDTFMGDRIAQDHITSNILVFYHWLRTEVNTIYQMARHPIENSGAVINTIITGAIMFGANKAWQGFTGNDNASVRTPGTLGFIKDAFKAPGEIAQNTIPGIITNHVNPLIKTAVDQLSGHQNFTDKKLNTWSDRGGDLVNSLIPDVAQINKVQSGAHSFEENLANQVAGLYTPHVKGTAAAPNFPDAVGFNTAGATSNTNDAYASQKQNYAALDVARKSFGNDQLSLDQFNSYVERAHNDQGQSVQEDPDQRLANAKMLLANPKVRNAVASYEQSQTNHDPMWDLKDQQGVNVDGKPTSKLNVFLTQQAMPTGDDQLPALKQQNPWLKDFDTERANILKQQSFSGTSVKSEWDIQHPYPVTDTNTTNALNTYFNMLDGEKTADDKKATQAFSDAHPEVNQALDSIAKYNNEKRVNENAEPLKLYPQAPADVAAYMKNYNATTDKAARAQMRLGNPAMYQAMQDQYAKVDEYNLAKNAAQDQYQASPGLNQKALAAIYGIGQFDLTKNADGSFAFGSTKNGANKSGSSFGSSSSSAAASRAKRAVRQAASKTAQILGKAKAVHFTPSNPVKFANKQGANTTPKGPAGKSIRVGTAKSAVRQPSGTLKLQNKRISTKAAPMVTTPTASMAGLKLGQNALSTSGNVKVSDKKMAGKGVKIA